MARLGSRGRRSVILILALLVAISLVAWGCGEKEAAKEEPYKVGAVLSLSGTDAPRGQPEEKAIKLFQEQINEEGGINGHKLEVVILDDQSDPAKAKTNITRLINQEKVPAVIGSSTTGATLTMVPVAEENKVPLVCLAAGTKITHPVNKWVFRTPPSDAMAIERVLQYLTEDLKATKIAVLHDENAFGTRGADELEEKAPGYGIEIVSRESYGSEDTDMTAQLTKIQGTPAEAVVVWGTNPGPASIAKNMKQLNMTIPMVGSHGICNKKFIELAGDAAEGVVHPGGRLLIAESIPEGSEQAKLVEDFAEAYKARWGEEIDTYAAHGWDAIAMISKAMETAGTDPAKIRDELEKTEDFVGADGVYTYSATDHDGLKISDLIMIRIENGDWTWVK